jgi:hypothetical protein
MRMHENVCLNSIITCEYGCIDKITRKEYVDHIKNNANKHFNYLKDIMVDYDKIKQENKTLKEENASLKEEINMLNSYTIVNKENILDKKPENKKEEKTEEKKIKIEEKNQIEKQFKTVHQRITCDNCHESNIKGSRFNCNYCDDYDLCENCYPKLAQIKHNHSFTEYLDDQYMKRSITKQKQIQCDNCSTKEFTGNRYVCKKCPNYDLCQGCFEKGRKLHGHHFICYSRPEEEYVSSKIENGMKVLERMGFDKVDLNMELLKKYKGNTNMVVVDLLNLNKSSK